MRNRRDGALAVPRGFGCRRIFSAAAAAFALFGCWEVRCLVRFSDFTGTLQTGHFSVAISGAPPPGDDYGRRLFRDAPRPPVSEDERYNTPRPESGDVPWPRRTSRWASS